VKSLLYQNIWLYRALMQCLYLGRASNRYTRITALLPPDVHSVIELCFGDTAVAQFCRDRGIQWTGYDLSENFVGRAQALGYDAHVADILKLESLPKCDVVIMLGSLYHFPESLDLIFNKVLDSSPRLILSEAISNLASKNGLIGSLARVMTDAGNGPESFRFSRESLMAILNEQAKRLGCEIQFSSNGDREMIVVLQRA